jgi:aryl-alcohol dehydrogenase-like predicted oxidoreductase
MRYKLLGRSGLRVSEAALGAMTFGEEWGTGADKSESERVYRAFVEAGGNFIDTANRYTEGTSERWLGEFMSGERDRIVLATKYTLFTEERDVNGCGAHRKNLVRSLEGSLRRLQTDYVDLLYVHAWDYDSPVEEVMRALDDLVAAGKVLYVGVSDAPAWIVSRANTIADFRGWSPFVALQIEYSLATRDAERELLPMARDLDVSVTTWGSLGGGVLTGKYLDARDEKFRLKEGSRHLNERTLAIAKVVVEIAEEIGESPSQVALNWLRFRKGEVIPVLGARTLDQLKDNLGAFDFELDAERLARLDEASAIDLGFPHEFLARENIRDFVYGGNYEKIDHRRMPL